jgi:dynein heavy chain
MAILLDLQSRSTTLGAGDLSPDVIALTVTQDVIQRFCENKFDTDDILRSLEEQGLYQNVFLQEMDKMNNMLTE